jgi:hypothetical protein
MSGRKGNFPSCALCSSPRADLSSGATRGGNRPSPVRAAQGSEGSRGTHQHFGQTGGPGAQLPAMRETGEGGQSDGPHRQQAPGSRVGADALAMRHESFLKGLLDPLFHPGCTAYSPGAAGSWARPTTPAGRERGGGPAGVRHLRAPGHRASADRPVKRLARHSPVLPGRAARVGSCCSRAAPHSGSALPAGPLDWNDPASAPRPPAGRTDPYRAGSAARQAGYPCEAGGRAGPPESGP